jgi:hypothetical protein
MGDVVNLNPLSTPFQVVSAMTEEELEGVESLAVVRLNSEGEVLVAHNRMTPERLYYLAGVLQRYALSL